MPVYEYACTECGERLEVRQSFTDDPLSVCPACSGKLRKVLSPVGVVFKGSGFYRTDSRASSGASATSESGTGKTDSGSGSGSGDSSSSTSSTSSSGDSGSSSSASSSSSSSSGGSAAAKAAS